MLRIAAIGFGVLTDQTSKPYHELLAFARVVASQTGGLVTAVWLGTADPDAAGALILRGADEVQLLSIPRSGIASAPQDNPAEAYLPPEHALIALEWAATQFSPDIMLLPADTIGAEVGPRLAHRIGGGIVTDVTGFGLNNTGTISWQRPIYGGKAVAVMIAQGKPQIATMRARAFVALSPDQNRQGKIMKSEITENPPLRVTLQEVVREETAGVRLEDAKIIVSGGRGIGGAEGFKELQHLADLLRGAVGCSRQAADAGWLASSSMVGQTGKIVSPDIYIAIGISGSSQHMAGVKARLIVAINNDKDAPIFNVAQVGVLSDWRKIVPALARFVQEQEVKS